jgi:hypothetical protein
MHEPNAACAATTDFGLRREAKRHAAFGNRQPYGKRCRRCALLPQSKISCFDGGRTDDGNLDLNLFIPFVQPLASGLGPPPEVAIEYTFYFPIRPGQFIL